MQIEKNKYELQDFSNAIQHEWLETNGLGGWSGSSVIGCNTRRYHGLLVAATNPPAERMALISKMDETIVVKGQRYELGVNQYRGDVIHPEGHKHLQHFSKGFFPQWTYEAGDVRIRKTIAMIHGENTTVVLYEILKAGNPFNIEWLPLLSVRGYHSMMHANDAVERNAIFENGIFQTKLYGNTPGIFIKLPGAGFDHQPDWYYNFHYSAEQYRGLEAEEDLFTPGTLQLGANEGDMIGIVLSDEDPSAKNAFELFEREKIRRQSLLRHVPEDDTIRMLTLASDQFIVKRDENLKTVIAGYHWFTDWGRDTMISLPGLCLSTGMFENARKIIAAFSKTVNMGMLPNRFQDNGAPPEYNNVDGTLWYFIAVQKYLEASGDLQFVLNEILPVLKDIIDWHYAGTRYNIHVEDDGLLYSGEAGVQLTWMDAKVGDWVVTPRTGKAVEVNALWYNALNIYAKLLQLNGDSYAANEIYEKITLIKQNFEAAFWNEATGYLYDVINNGDKDDTLRPNQLFAIGLPFPLIEGCHAESILDAVSKKLYTPVGLRTLPQDHPSYAGKYGGGIVQRDSAYHQGTVWSWLLGIYVDALIKVKGSDGVLQAQQVMENFTYHLSEGCIGSVAEIFDADAPHHPRGCVAQAWSVAEIIRLSCTVIKSLPTDRALIPAGYA
jgi:predicted glycogen debranching enzyme